MSERDIASILESLFQLTPQFAGAEVTLECEPGTIDQRKLRAARAAGVNRVSVCAQSFDDAELKRISRKHSHEQSLRLIDDCLAAGIENLHLDLMYGLPGQTLRGWEQTLEAAARLPFRHLSAYKFYVFRHSSIQRGNAAPRPEAEADIDTRGYQAMHDATRVILGGSDFQQYSLTEFARPGSQSLYIRGCFDGSDLLPIGPSAFGRCGQEVWDNSPYVQLYGTPGAERFDRALKLSPVQAFKRDIILGLWLLRVSVSEAARQHTVVPGPRLLELLAKLHDDGALRFDGECIVLEPEHRFHAGKAMQQLSSLDAGGWGSAPQGVRRASSEGRAVVLAPEVNAILRVARIDRGLFAALERDPRVALARLDHKLDPTELAALCDAIRENDIPSQHAGLQELRDVWSAVRAEHQRPASGGRRAGR